MKRGSGFTLIELLIVIVIIGILSAALIPRITGVRDRAKYTAVTHTMRELQSAIFLAQTSSQTPLIDITRPNDPNDQNDQNPLHGHTFKPCLILENDGSTNRDVAGYQRIIDPSGACRSAREAALENIVTAGGLGSGALDDYKSDPRGNPYLLDENEGQHVDEECQQDELFSIGTATDEEIIIDNDHDSTRIINEDIRHMFLQGLYCDSF